MNRNTDKIIDLAREYVSVKECSCKPEEAIVCWRCLFEYNLRFVKAAQLPLAPEPAESQECKDCKEEFGHPDNCVGCEHTPLR